MTKKKSIVSKLLLLVLLLTLVSCCFLGSTFARYTSGGTGSATVSVAKWVVTQENAESANVEFGKLSPDDMAYGGGESYVEDNVREHTTGKKLVAQINYEVEVTTTITFTIDELKFTGNGAESAVEFGESGYDADDLNAVFAVKFTYGTTNTPEGDTTELANAGKITLTPSGDPAVAQGTYYVWAEVVWTSDTAECFGDDADARDTWIAANVTGLSCSLAYTAVQASELPVSA